VLFLRESRGLERLKALFALGNENDSEATLRESFERIYAVPLEQIENEWMPSWTEVDASLPSMPRFQGAGGVE